MADLRKDLPPASAANFLDRVREEVSTFLGFRGDPLDRAVTLRDLTDADLVSLRNGYKGGKAPISGPGTAWGGSTVPVDSEPDLTPPPTPTGGSATATFSNLLIQHDSPLYTAGHGHARTRVFGATYGGTGPLPTFADAVQITEFTGTVFAHPTSLGVTWRIWLKWVTKDGVESTVPAGGTNGYGATTGRVGSSDLGDAIVLSQALAPGSVTADKAALDIGGSNLVGNNSFEVDSNADGIADGWALYDGTGGGSLSRVPGRISGYAQRYTTTAAVATHQRGMSGGTGLIWQPNRTFVLSLYARAPAGSGFLGKTLGPQWNTGPAITELRNPPLSTSWQRYAWRLTWGAGVEPAGPLYVSVPNQGTPTGAWDADDVQVEEGDTLTGYQGKLALNTIVAGDGAIANLAITNALIANLAVDDAKVASMSVAKLLAGSLSVGQYIRSTSYVPGSAGWTINADGSAEFSAASIRGQLTAAQLDARGLTIRKPDGSIILDASGTGTPISYLNILPDGGWLNANVAIPRGTLNADPGLLDANNAWLWDAGINVQGPSAAPGALGVKYFSADTAGNKFAWSRQTFPISASRTYNLSALLYAAAGNDRFMFLVVDMFKADGTRLTGVDTGWGGSYAGYTFGGIPAAGQFTRYGDATDFGAGTPRPIPAAAAYFRVGAWFQYSEIGSSAVQQAAEDIRLVDVTDARVAATTSTWAGVSGAGKPQDNATVGATIGANLGGNFSQASWDVVMNGQALIRAAHIQQLTTANLSVTTLSNVINGSVSSSGRIEVTTNRMDVYDATNALRGRFGML